MSRAWFDGSKSRSMTGKLHHIEVYQELEIGFDATLRDVACGTLEKVASENAWHRTTEVEQRIEANYPTEVHGVLAFEREADSGPAVRVVLWPADEEPGQVSNGSQRYRVVNIVPVEPGELGVQGYNDALEGFLRDVVEPARESLDIDIEVSAREQTMTDWTSEEAAGALRRFSAAANRSTGTSHPADEKRWWAFVVADHRARGTLRGQLLRQWLIEVDRWPAEVASDLVSDWEKGQELLATYDATS